MDEILGYEHWGYGRNLTLRPVFKKNIISSMTRMLLPGQWIENALESLMRYTMYNHYLTHGLIEDLLRLHNSGESECGTDAFVIILDFANECSANIINCSSKGYDLLAKHPRATPNGGEHGVRVGDVLAVCDPRLREHNSPYYQMEVPDA